MEHLHRSHYTFKIETFTSLLDPKNIFSFENPDPLQNLRDSDVTRCVSGSDTGVEHGFKKMFYF
jgi:hypothetical protein